MFYISYIDETPDVSGAPLFPTLYHFPPQYKRIKFKMQAFFPLIMRFQVISYWFISCLPIFHTLHITPFPLFFKPAFLFD